MSGRPGPLGCLPSQNPALSLSAGGSTSAACMDARGWPPGRWLCPPGIVLLAFASLLSCLLPSGQAKIYSRCELTRTLQNFGLEGYRGYSLADCENPFPWLAPGSLPPALPPSSSPSSSLKGCGLGSFLILSSRL